MGNQYPCTKTQLFPVSVFHLNGGLIIYLGVFVLQPVKHIRQKRMTQDIIDRFMVTPVNWYG